MEERFIFVDNLKINYKIGGNGPTILILHGWDSSSEKWLKVGKILMNSGFRVIIPDLPGFGKSSFPPIPWTVSDYLEAVLKFVEKVGGEKPILVAHSFGGRIAIKFGAVYPEKISCLILCSPAGIISRKKAKVKFFNLATKIGKNFFSLPVLKNFQNFARRLLYRMSGTRDYLRATPLMRETMKKIISENLFPFLPRIKLKTLIIWGKEDKTLPVSDAYLIKEKIPDSELIIMERIGHALNLDVPEELAKIILNWQILKDERDKYSKANI